MHAGEGSVPASWGATPPGRVSAVGGVAAVGRVASAWRLAAARRVAAAWRVAGVRRAAALWRASTARRAAAVWIAPAIPTAVRQPAGAPGRAARPTRSAAAGRSAVRRGSSTARISVTRRSYARAPGRGRVAGGFHRLRHRDDDDAGRHLSRRQDHRRWGAGRRRRRVDELGRGRIVGGADAVAAAGPAVRLGGGEHSREGEGQEKRAAHHVASGAKGMYVYGSERLSHTMITTVHTLHENSANGKNECGTQKSVRVGRQEGISATDEARTQRLQRRPDRRHEVGFYGKPCSASHSNGPGGAIGRGRPWSRPGPWKTHDFLIVACESQRSTC